MSLTHELARKIETTDLQRFDEGVHALKLLLIETVAVIDALSRRLDAVERGAWPAIRQKLIEACGAFNSEAAERCVKEGRDPEMGIPISAESQVENAPATPPGDDACHHCWLPSDGGPWSCVKCNTPMPAGLMPKSTGPDETDRL